jgi:hypothetical protein
MKECLIRMGDMKNVYEFSVGKREETIRKT